MTIDIMATPRTGASVDPVGQIHALAVLLDTLGLPDELVASRRLLAQSEDLAARARDRQAEARKRLTQAQHALISGAPVDMAALERLLVSEAVWVAQAPAEPPPRPAPGAALLMDASRACRGNAVQALAAEASGVYAKLQLVVHAVVVATAALPVPPREVWQAQQPDQAAARVGYASMQRLWELSQRFDLVHQAGTICRATGGLGAQAMLNGPPEPLGFTARNWPKAVGELAELKQVRPPLKLRWMHDHQWEPGLWLADDLRGVEQEQRRRGPLGFLIPSPLRAPVGS